MMKIFLFLIFLGNITWVFAQGTATIENRGLYALKVCLCTDSNCSDGDFVCTPPDVGSGLVCSCDKPVKCHSGIAILEKARFDIPKNCPAIAVYTEIWGKGEEYATYGKFLGNGGYMKAGTTVTLTGTVESPESNFDTTPSPGNLIQKSQRSKN